MTSFSRDFVAAVSIAGASSHGSLAACSARSMIASITFWLARWANMTAPSIWSSDSSLASDSTIITASRVPATTRSRSPSAICWLDGLRIYSPPIMPTRAAPIGPMKGTPEMVSAADAAIIATMSGSLSPS